MEAAHPRVLFEVTGAEGALEPDTRVRTKRCHAPLAEQVNQEGLRNQELRIDTHFSRAKQDQEKGTFTSCSKEIG